MHHDEIFSDVGLVRRLVDGQLPQWADLSVTAVPSTGTANALYRLGDELVVRMPLRPSEKKPLAKELRWLPILAPQLTLMVPVPVVVCEATHDFPWPWGVYPWLTGEDATISPIDQREGARDLAHFIGELHAVDPTGGPAPSSANYGRGAPLVTRDEYTRQAIAASRGLVDVEAIAAAWDDALRTPRWARPGVWIHGDIAAGNLLVHDGRLSAVIDWGGLGVGDPAVDLIVAWELLDVDARAVFREVLDVDDATWARGRGWALSTAIVALPYYQHTNAFMAAQARRKLAAVLLDGNRLTTP